MKRAWLAAVLGPVTALALTGFGYALAAVLGVEEAIYALLGMVLVAIGTGAFYAFRD